MSQLGPSGRLKNQKEGQMKFRFFTTILIVYQLNSLFAISGISSKKLVIPSAYVLEKGTTEIDINFYILKSTNQYNEKGKITSYEWECSTECKKNAISEGGFTFRTTGGIGSNIEIGVEGGHTTKKNQVQDFTYSNIDDIKFGFKWNFFDFSNEQIKISYQQGLTYDFETFTPQYETGFLISKDWESFSLDFDIHYISTKRNKIFEPNIIEQMSWYSGPHIGMGISYSILNFLFSIEYTYEEAKTKVKQFQYFSQSEFQDLQNKGYSYIFSIENVDLHQLLNLPNNININGILFPLPKIYKQRDYYTISRTIYYGFSYSISEHLSISFIIHDVVGGSNVDNNKIINIVTTFNIL